MHFYCLQYHMLQDNYHFYWRSGKLNKGDYYTKHHPAIHHQHERPTILNFNNVTADFIGQGCIGMSIYARAKYVHTPFL